MKNRIIITISDIKGTKSYSISTLLKKYLIWIVAFVVLTASFGAIVVPILVNRVMDLSKKNEIYKQKLDQNISVYDNMNDELAEMRENIKLYEEGAKITLQRSQEYARKVNVKNICWQSYQMVLRFQE